VGVYRDSAHAVVVCVVGLDGVETLNIC
jgi:hypothetical protein